ncbi:MAG: VWA domain-containing protein [Deltaproteobacteria bacterium]|nr:VWA domain-containing protein [Deltaproteobacteria bacterium]
MQTRGTRTDIYPFAAIAGQSQMKLALILNAILPAIGGVLIRGHKGTAKSTAVRGLAQLLKSQNGDASLTELPLCATEDMVVGAIDMEAAIKEGKKKFQPGLLKRANGGMLYVDEVNLLDDHLVECILDAAETGWNRVEREGLRTSHAARFSLVGSMNPEEGELRPQLLDRFGLSVQVEGETDTALRVELMRRREQFDNNPGEIISGFITESRSMSERIEQARGLAPKVTVPSHLLKFVAEIAEVNNVAGHRADLAIERAARAHAAWCGRDVVVVADIQAVAPMALLHRTREQAPPQIPPSLPPEDSEDNAKDNSQQEKEEQSAPNPPQEENSEASKSGPVDSSDTPDASDEQTTDNDSINPDEKPDNTTAEKEDSPKEEHVFKVGAPFSVKPLVSDTDRHRRTGSGRRSRSRSANKQGRYIKSTSRRQNGDLALDATLRAAAPFQKSRRETMASTMAVHIRESDIREKIRQRRMGNILVFVVDGSGSMGAHKRMVETKAAVLSVLMDAYQKRDQVAVIVFRGRNAVIALPPTSSVELASRMLTDMPIGGRTPLSAGLGRMSDMLTQIHRKNPLSRPIAILLTDGKSNAALGEGPAHLEAIALAGKVAQHHRNVRFIVVDTESPGAIRLRLAQKLASALNASYFEPENLRAKEIVNVIKEIV